MKCDKEMMTLYAITDRKWTGKQSLYEQVESALKGGATVIQLREKQLDEKTFLKEARELKTLCHKYNVPLIINDNIDIMLQSDADGVHVGQDDTDVKEARERIGNDKILGVSCHNPKEAIKAVHDGANYLGVGSVFQTHTKDNVVHLTHTLLKDITSSVDVPIVAIGGISKDNIMELQGTGVNGVALVSAIFSAENIEEETKELYRLSKQMTGGTI